MSPSSSRQSARPGGRRSRGDCSLLAAELDDELMVTIGYTEDGIKRGSYAMANMVMDAWLAAYPADIAMSNPGGFRQDIDRGEIAHAGRRRSG